MENRMPPVIVIGGGPAGMMAALSCQQEGCPTVLLEKNTQLGKKMRIAGKGRCNITNDCSLTTLVNNMPGGGKFLYSAFTALPPSAVMALFTEAGVPLKVERGQRVFPVSDQSSDIVNCLERQIRKAGVDIRFHSKVDALHLKDDIVDGVILAGRLYRGGAVIIATGGLSYPLTGSDGDGYRWAEQAGHRIVPTFPSLVPLVVRERYAADLEGLSLRNVTVRISDEHTVLTSAFGELVFTSFGLSGPAILTASRACAYHFQQRPTAPLSLSLDLKPALDDKQLDQRLQRDFDTYAKRKYATILEQLLPRKMIPTFVVLSGIDPWKQGHQLNKQDRQTIRRLLKSFPFTVTGCRPLEEAIVTAGGVDLKEIAPPTMASKLTPGLFFAGEVMDIDGYTGGFNIQAAFATGYRAGLGAAAYVSSHHQVRER